MALTTPPKDYGGLERVVADYAVGLSGLGHEVTVYATKGSKIPNANVRPVTVSWSDLLPEEKNLCGKADRQWDGWRVHEELAYMQYGHELQSYDVVGDHAWCKWSYNSKKEEIVGTGHSILPFGSRPPRQYPMLTGVSRGHARNMWQRYRCPVGTLLDCFDINQYQMQREKSDRVLSLNRIMKEKGIHLFLDVVLKNNIPSDVAGDDSTLVQDQSYVQLIKKRCDGTKTQYWGLVDEQTRRALLAQAKCLVCLKDFGYEEVFGLAAVEALASGTPVIAAKSWGYDNIIEHGKSGFIANDINEVAKYLDKVKEIKSEDCRKRAEYFSLENRSRYYSRMLEKVKSGTRW